MKYKVWALGLFSNGIGVFKIKDIDKAPFLDRRMLIHIENKAKRFRQEITVYTFNNRGVWQTTQVVKPANIPNRGNWAPVAPRRNRKQDLKAQGKKPQKRRE